MRQKFITKCVRFFIKKMRQLLEIATMLLQNATAVTKCDVYYKLRQYISLSLTLNLKFEKFYIALQKNLQSNLYQLKKNKKQIITATTSEQTTRATTILQTIMFNKH